jgi:hypothetical protein
MPRGIVSGGEHLQMIHCFFKQLTDFGRIFGFLLFSAKEPIEQSHVSSFCGFVAEPPNVQGNLHGQGGLMND